MISRFPQQRALPRLTYFWSSGARLRQSHAGIQRTIESIHLDREADVKVRFT